MLTSIFLVSLVFAQGENLDNTDFVQMNAQVPNTELVREIVDAAVGKIREGADTVRMAKEAARATKTSTDPLWCLTAGDCTSLNKDDDQYTCLSMKSSENTSDPCYWMGYDSAAGATKCVTASAAEPYYAYARRRHTSTAQCGDKCTTEVPTCSKTWISTSATADNPVRYDEYRACQADCESKGYPSFAWWSGGACACPSEEWGTCQTEYRDVTVVHGDFSCSCTGDNCADD